MKSFCLSSSLMSSASVSSLSLCLGTLPVVRTGIIIAVYTHSLHRVWGTFAEISPWKRSPYACRKPILFISVVFVTMNNTIIINKGPRYPLCLSYSRHDHLLHSGIVVIICAHFRLHVGTEKDTICRYEALEPYALFIIVWSLSSSSSSSD